ncbi:MAG: hypothetical protein R3F60_11875 [bacterium]
MSAGWSCPPASPGGAAIRHRSASSRPAWRGIAHVDTIKKSVLRPALLRLAVDSDEKALPSDHRNHLNRFENRLENWVDDRFFPDLWRDADLVGDERDAA